MSEEKNWKEKIVDKINMLVKYSYLLNEKEQEFIDSMQIRVSNEKEITWPMHKYITDIYNRYI